MRVQMVYVGTSVAAYGFRLLASIVREKFPDTACRFVIFHNLRSIVKLIFSSPQAEVALSERDVATITTAVADCDVLGIACMSEHAAQVKILIEAARKANPNIYIVWGGVHAVIHPEDAIQHADAVCVSEAETVFPELLQKLQNGEVYTDVKSFWFRSEQQIIKNGFAPLLTSEELDTLPLPVYGEDEQIYEIGSNGFELLSQKYYLNYDALSYNTVWTRGCPYRCTYCSNSRFLEIDMAYGKLRHSTVEHMISEIRAVIDRMPHISSIAFHDDCFIALPPELLQEFADKMKSEIGLPLAIHGVTPADIRKEKIGILLGGGLNRVRMGVQSGSDRILKFYKRPNRAGFVKQAVDVLGEFPGRMMPPAYDMIFDNPIETEEDVRDTLRLLYEMPRPFTLNIFSLRYIPNTELGKQLEALGAEVEGIDKNYNLVRPTFANVLMYLVQLVKLPRSLFEYLLKFAKPYKQSTQGYGYLITFLNILVLAQRFYYHMKWKDFSVVLGPLGWRLKRWGMLKNGTACERVDPTNKQ
ncbi:MAG: radical SAM protein [Gallionellaceae bacterium]